MIVTLISSDVFDHCFYCAVVLSDVCHTASVTSLTSLSLACQALPMHVHHARSHSVQVKSTFVSRHSLGDDLLWTCSLCCTQPAMSLISLTQSLCTRQGQ